MSEHQDSDHSASVTIATTAPTPDPVQVVICPGTTIDRYVVHRQIGQGKMGVVCSAFDPQLDRKVAIKLVSGERGVEDETRMLREARTLAALSHPNIIPIFDAGLWDSNLYIAMEYIEGDDLAGWLSKQPRGWKEILGVFKRAGRGLAAAHAAGIVHRDFKPQNVLIARNGQVKVIDFGIAIRSDSPDLDSEHKPGMESPGGVVEQSQSEVGPIVGTPFYMSVEQHSGMAPDARSDQFNFCASLYFALYRQQPYEGRTMEELAAKKIAGTIAMPPAASKVPAWLRRIIFKGMAPRREERWPSMDVLLDKLNADPSVKRRKILLAVLMAILLLVVGYLGIEAGVRKEDVCGGGEGYLSGVWSMTQKQRLKQSLAKTQISEASVIGERVEKALDAYAEQWVTGYRQACEATQIKHEQSAQLMDLRMHCLKRNLFELKALLGILFEADPETARRAAEAVGKLPEVGRCSNGEALWKQAQAYPPPSDPARAEYFRERIAKARALDKVVQFQNCLKTMEAVWAEAKDYEYLPIQAEALYMLGRARYMSGGSYQEAIEEIRKSALMAIRSQQDLVYVRAAIELARLLGSTLNENLLWIWWADSAEAMLDRLPGEDPERARLYSYIAYVYIKRGDFKNAYQFQKKSVEIWERQKDPNDVFLSDTYYQLGSILVFNNRGKEGIGYLEKSLQLSEKVAGSDNYLAAQILTSMSVYYMRIRNYAKALEVLNRSAALNEAFTGRKSRGYAYALHDRGIVRSLMGDHDGALADLQESYHSAVKNNPAVHPDVAGVLIELGAAYFRKGELKNAQKHYQEGLDMVYAALGREHSWAAETLLGLGNTFRAMQDRTRARSAFVKSIEIYQKTLGATDPATAAALNGLGWLELDEHRYAQAKVQFELALDALKTVEGADPNQQGSAQFGLSRALWFGKLDQPRARDMALDARTSYVEAGSQAEGKLKEVEKFVEKIAKQTH